MLIRCTALCLCVLLSFASFAQYFEKEKQLISRVENAGDDSTKVVALSKLADFYYTYRANTKGDSILQEQLSLAELSTNKNLLLLALFDKSVTIIANWSSAKNFDKSLVYLDKGAVYARQIGRKDYEAIAHLRKASINRKRGHLEAASNDVLLGLSALGNEKQDSLRATFALETGDIAAKKGKAIEAYKHYNQAYDIAYSLKNNSLICETYHHYAQLYHDLNPDDPKLAKENLLKSLEINKKNNDTAGIFQDYFDLARFTDIKEYHEKVIELSKQLPDERSKIRAKRLMFSYIMTVGKNASRTLGYYYQNPDLQQSFINSGLPVYYMNLGHVYKYGGVNDSALYYFKKAESELSSNFDGGVVQSAFTGMAECYEAIGNLHAAVTYFKKSVEINKSAKDLPAICSLTLKLSDLYWKMSDYKNAYVYQKQYVLLKDTVSALAEKSQVTLLEVERINNKHEKDMEDAIIKESRIRNLQYMGISAAIATLFIFMMLLGMFPISKMTIKMLSFFAFICLFEFIVLLIDSYLHKLTHGQPLKIWLIKIVLIALLVPIQHFLEHGMVRFLASQRLLRMRQHLSIRRWIMKLKKPTPVIEVGPKKDSIERMEEDTAVL
jgi:tetratricopeptide (TPR) repeat protein